MYKSELNSLRFWNTNWLPDLGQKTIPWVEENEMFFFVLVNKRLSMKESKENDKIDVSSKKDQRDVRVSVTLMVSGAIGSTPKCFEKGLEEMEIEGWIETFQTPKKIG